jgi:peptide/nickel transport system substrate-binding protein
LPSYVRLAPWCCRAIRSIGNLDTGSINTTGYSSKAADDLIVQAARETDEAKRKTLYLQLKQLIWKDVPLLFVHYETLNYLMRKPVVGSTIVPTLELGMGKVGMNSA